MLIYVVVLTGVMLSTHLVLSFVMVLACIVVLTCVIMFPRVGVSNNGVSFASSGNHSPNLLPERLLTSFLGSS